MERLWAKNRVAVILTAALVVGMYIFWFMGKARAESMLTSAWGFAVPLILAALVGVVGERSGAVSYTHLDVYKRQVKGLADGSLKTGVTL